MLWLNSILGSNFIFLCFKLQYPKTKENKIWAKDKIEPQHIVHIETVTHSSYKDYVFSWIFQDFVLSNSAYLLIFELSISLLYHIAMH